MKILPKVTFRVLTIAFLTTNPNPNLWGWTGRSKINGMHFQVDDA
jgi:hypothetical protein